MPTADLHTGASFALMMRLVESIAKNGFNGFAINVINNVTNDLQKIIAERDQAS